MNKIINNILFYGKMFLLIISFIITFYILLLKMDFYNESVFPLLSVFFPFLLVLIIFVVSFFFKYGQDNMFFNMVCILALTAIIIINYRTLFDKNIIPDYITKFNFAYFNNNIFKVKIMLYLTFVGNLFLLCYEKRKNK